MKIVFFTSILNHHQLPFCLEMYKVLGNNFTLITTKEIEKQRIVLGYRDLSTEYSFSFKMHSSSENYNRAFYLSQECDVLIAGVIPEEFVKKRMKLKKLTFRYSERFFENGMWRVLSPRGLKNAYLQHYKYRNHPLYLLCASAYLPNDAAFIFSYPNKMFKWGYFTEFMNYEINNLIRKKRSTNIKLLWVGRFLKLKQPQHAILAAKYIDKLGIKFRLEMIGTGPLLKKITQLAKKYNLEDKVIFSGPLSPEEVRKRMVDSNIFLFTSNKREGWGAVLNEAMNSGCAIIANKSIGAVPYLIRDNQNGLVYNQKHMSNYYKIVAKICIDDKLREKISKNAYKTIEEEWNPNIAVKRLLLLIENILQPNNFHVINHGPASIAEKIE